MKIAFWGNFGALNLGNECTLAAAVGNFRARLPEAELIVICRDPGDTATRHGLQVIPMSERRQPANGAQWPKPLRIVLLIVREAAAWGRAFRHASGIDALLITGSGILSDDGEGTLGLPYELFKWSLVTKLRRKKLFFVSVGAESIGRRLSAAFIKAALRLADYRSYRDAHSAKLLRSLGFNTDRDAVCPDLAFSLPGFAAGTAVSAAVTPDVPRRPRVAVGVFNYRGRGQANPQDAAAYHAYLDRICALIQWLLAHDYATTIVIGDFAYDDDVRLDVQAELARRGGEFANRSYAGEPTTSFEQLMVQLAAVDFIIASRYHNLILGLLLGKPVVSLSYEGKHEALMSAFGLDQYCQSLEDWTVERLLQQFQLLQSNADSLRVAIGHRAAANRTRLDEQYELIATSVSRLSARYA
jgi:polysaccharide pyruvyl transferase WcaK-like protein